MRLALAFLALARDLHVDVRRVGHLDDIRLVVGASRRRGALLRLLPLVERLLLPIVHVLQNGKHA